MAVGWIMYLILVTAVYNQNQLIFNQKPINRLALLTRALRLHGYSNIFIVKIIDMKVIILVTAVYKQSNVIFNQKPYACTFISMFERIDMKKWTGADPVACFF